MDCFYYLVQIRNPRTYFNVLCTFILLQFRFLSHCWFLCFITMLCKYFNLLTYIDLMCLYDCLCCHFLNRLDQCNFPEPIPLRYSAFLSPLLTFLPSCTAVLSRVLDLSLSYIFITSIFPLTTRSLKFDCTNLVCIEQGFQGFANDLSSREKTLCQVFFS